MQKMHPASTEASVSAGRLNRGHPLEAVTMKGKTVVITGATSGIGLEAAKQLAKLGARLIMVGRDATKGKAALAAVQEGAPQAQVEEILGDLGVHGEVRRIGKEIGAATKRIDVLMNNAGLYMPKFTETSDGIETTFAVNHLGYAHLTDILLPTLHKTAKAEGSARIVSTASAAHLSANLNPDDLEMRHGYRGWTQYCNTKLLNILWTRRLARDLHGTDVTANCLHPGVINTRLARRSKFANPLFKLFGVSVAKGADTMVWLASSDEASALNGEYLAKRTRSRMSAAALNDTVADMIWDHTQKYLRNQ